MANNFAEAFLGARNAAQDRMRQREADAMQRQQFDVQMQGAQQKQQASQQQALYGLAKGYKDYLSQNPQGGAAYYENFLRPSLAGLGLGDAGPYNEQEAVSLADQVLAAYGGGTTGGTVQSTFINDRGERVAIMRDGSVQVLGQNAPNNQIIDTGDGFVGVNKGNLRASPVVVGGGQPQGLSPGTYQTPGGIVRVGDVAPEDQEAMLADIARNGQGGDLRLPQRDVSPQQAGQQLRSIPRPQPAPAGYVNNPDGSQSVIPGGPADIARQAREAAAAARKAAEDVKAAQKAQEAQTRQAESASTASNLVNAIDTLTRSPGFSSLGTALGDAQIAIPVIRNDAKDADAQLKNIAGQVAMATLSRLKSLSATGATGFGALSNQELNLIQNSIATLQSDKISNAELARSLKIIRDGMEKVANWQPTQGGYQLGQIIEANGKRYRITGLDDPNDPDVEEVR